MSLDCNWPLPDGLRSRMLTGINGLDIHCLEAGFETPGRPLVVLLHGFPEFSFSWRNVMPVLAHAGYHVVAPDQRGFGLTTGWDGHYDGDVASFRTVNLVRDVLGLMAALGYDEIGAAIGHDAGAAVAASCALMRPDIVHAAVMMSAPYAGPPPLVAKADSDDIDAALAALDPPRKHYKWYYSSRQADDDMMKAAQGLEAFLRAYFHHKSADWPDNTPFRLAGWRAEELAKMPTYYIMPLDATMPQAVASEMPSIEEVETCDWLSRAELAVYASTYRASGFQGGLNWYRCQTGGLNTDLGIFSGRTIDVPAMFVAGRSDWGVYQTPGAVEHMASALCTDWRGTHLIDGAGHWVQQERPDEVSRLLVDFLATVSLPLRDECPAGIGSK